MPTRYGFPESSMRTAPQRQDPSSASLLDLAVVSPTSERVRGLLGPQPTDPILAGLRTSCGYRPAASWRELRSPRMTELRTPRLVLRQWTESDHEPFAALNADPEVMQCFPAALTRE